MSLYLLVYWSIMGMKLLNKWYVQVGYCDCQKSSSRKNKLKEKLQQCFPTKNLIIWWALVQKCPQDVFPNCFTVRSEGRSVNVNYFMDIVFVYVEEFNWSSNNDNKLKTQFKKHSFNMSDNRCSKSQILFWCREPQNGPWGKYSEALIETNLANYFLRFG